MPGNKTATDRLHDQMPGHYNTRTNPNWMALLDAIGGQDQATQNLLVEVKKQFFVKTAYAPYLDVLGANVGVNRPPVVGMDDTSFQEFIPVLSYQPKQVKRIIDQLLDIFFFKQSTTAYITSQIPAPYNIAPNSQMTYIVDDVNTETIIFAAADFTNIAAATAEEVVSCINRQANYSYAIDYHDSITNKDFIQIFTNTIGSTGSITLHGGEALVAFQFDGYNLLAGLGTNTQWTITKVGQLVTMTYVGGGNPQLNYVNIGDIIISNLPGLTPITGYQGNVGSFAITNVNLSNNSISFINLFGVPGTYTQTSNLETQFFTPNKYVAYTNPRRAMTWEVTEGEVIVEMPTSPPVVKRSLIGSAHLNGSVATVASTNPNLMSLTLQDATEFPNSGNFAILTPVYEILTHIQTPNENDTVALQYTGRLNGFFTRYHYTSRTVATTTGNITEGSNLLTSLASLSGIVVGQTIFTTGVRDDITVLDINVPGNYITMSDTSAATASGQIVAFGGNTLVGITPDLPAIAGLAEFTMSSLTRTSNIVTGTTTLPHGLVVGDNVFIFGSTGINQVITTANTTTGSSQLTNVPSIVGVYVEQGVTGPGIPDNAIVTDILGSGPYTVTMNYVANATATGVTVDFAQDLNGAFIVQSVPTPTTFTYILFGQDGTATVPGTVESDVSGLAPSGSQIILLDAKSNFDTRITGPYMWSPTAPFVLSANTAPIETAIQAGQIAGLLTLGANTIPATGGLVIFDYGLPTQEGPVKYLYKPTPTTIVIDPSYEYLFSHSIGSAVTAIRTLGPHVMSGIGTEYPPYITDPSQARIVLEQLIESVTSAGIFVDFLIRYPEQLYGTLNVYNS